MYVPAGAVVGAYVPDSDSILSILLGSHRTRTHMGCVFLQVPLVKIPL